MTNEKNEKEFLEFAISKIVDFPKKLSIKEVGNNFEILADKSDFGKIIGKGGQMIWALRILIRTMRSKNNNSAPVNIEILEKNGE